MADETNENLGGEANSAPATSRSFILLRAVFLSVVVAAAILVGIFVMDPEFLKEPAPLAADESAEGGEGQGGEGGGGRRGGRGGGFDPAAIFAERDADGNDILEGEEISERMAQRLDRIDGDGDGKITKEEFMSAIRTRGGGGRGEGGRGEGGDRASRRPGGNDEAATDDNSSAGSDAQTAADDAPPAVE